MSLRAIRCLIVFVSLFICNMTISNACNGIEETINEIKSTDFETILEIDLAKQTAHNSSDYRNCKDYKSKGDLAYVIGLKFFNLHTQASYVKAYDAFDLSLRYRIDSLDLKSYEDNVVKCKINLGRCRFKTNKLGDARRIFESCFITKDKIENQKTLGRLLFHLGEVYLEIGIFDRASSCFQEVIDLTNNGEESLFPYMVESYNYNGIALTENAETESAISNFETFGNDFLPEDDPYFLWYLRNIGFCRNDLKRYDEALKAFELIEQKLIKSFTIESLGSKEAYNESMCNCLLGQIRTFTKLSKIEEAERTIKKAAKYCESELVDFNDNRADILYLQGKLDAALTSYHQAIVSGFNLQVPMGNVFQLPDLSNKRPKQDKLRSLLEVTQSYGQTAFQLYRKNGNDKMLDAAYKAYDYYDQLFLLNFEKLLTDNSRYRLIEISRSAYEEAMTVANTLYQLSNKKETQYAEKAFYFAERIRANLLYTSISQKDALNQKLIPDKAKVDIENLSVEIRMADEALSASQDNQLKDSLKRNIEDLKIQLDHAKSKLAEEYPAYHQLAFSNHDIPSFEMIRKNVLSQENALVEYFVNNSDSSLYIWGISQENIYFNRIPFSDSIKLLIRPFLRSISDQKYIFDKKSGANELYFSTAQNLYDILLRNVLNKLSKSNGDLIIIPDGDLNLIPFATLLSDKPSDFYSAPYLVRKFSISYDYSAKSLVRNYRQTKNQRKYKVCGFAPKYDNNPDWGELLYNTKEVNALTSIFKQSSTFEKEAASRQAFEENCSECDILHISAHGFFDEDETMNNHLVFYKTDSTTPEILTVSRIHLQNLESRLTVLSSCETAMGELKSNEGLVSVSNAFSYAGSKSVMASLWLLNDKQAFKMMEHFYLQIKEGATMSSALSEAQLQVIKSSPINAHPYFWGNLMLSGNTDVLYAESSKKNYFLMIGGGILLLLLFGLFVVKGRKK